MSEVVFTGSGSSVTVTETPSVITVSDAGTVVTTLTTTTSSVAVTSPVNTIEVRDTFSDEYIRSLFGADVPLQYNATTGVFSIDENALFSGKTTDDLTEGLTNLYYTDQRVYDYIIANGLDFNAEKVDDRVAALIQNGTGISFAYNDVANTLTPTVSLASFTTDNLAEGTTNKYFSGKTTTLLPEGSNLYYTETRATNNFNTNFSLKSTTDLSEGTNLYYTQARFDSAFGAKSTTDLSEGTNLYFTDQRVLDTISNNTLVLKDYRETVVDLGSKSVSATVDFSLGSIFKMTITDNVTLSYTNLTAGKSFTMLVTVANAGGASVLFPVMTEQYVAGRDTINTANTKSSVIHAYYDGVTMVYNITDFDGDIPTLTYATTDELPEGITNLYYTDARATVAARNAISVSGDLSYNASTGVISYTHTEPTHQLDDLTDVDITGVQAGYVLVADGDGTYSFAAQSGGVSELDQLSDVDVTGATVGKVLQSDGDGTYSFVSLPSDLDNQTLSFSSPNLSISGGNSVDLSALLDNTDSQTLTWNSVTNQITISGGNSIDISTMAGITVDTLQLDTALNIDPAQGQFAWNPDKSTVALGLNGVELNLGQDELIYAKASEAITKGQVVMFAGAEGSHLLVKKADVNAPGFIDQWIVGIAKEDFTLNGFGFIQSFGTITDMNTSGYTLGDILYVDVTTPGALTVTKPSTPNHVILMAAVTNAHLTQGTLFVRPTFGEHLGDLYDVDVAGAQAGDVLVADGDGSYSFTKPGSVTQIQVIAQDTLTKGQVVMKSGGAIGYVLVDKAYPAEPWFSDEMIVGVTTTDIAYSDFGYIALDGYVYNLNTSAWPNGAILYADPASPGNLTNIKPSHAIEIATVTKSDAVTGSIYVKPVIGSHVDTLHDVNITTPADGEVLAYDSATSKWVNSAGGINEAQFVDLFDKYFAMKIVVDGGYSGPHDGGTSATVYGANDYYIDGGAA